MASLLPETDRARPTFSATTPHFFKIIPPDASRYTKPDSEEICEQYGENISSPIILKLPNGVEWEIQVRTCNGEVWFDKGWSEFSEFYCLVYGDCLVFRYKGNSKFHVCIFDRSATEIVYPLPLPEMEETDEDDDESVEVLEDFPPCPRTRQKSPLPCPPPHKKKRISTSSSKKFKNKSSSRRHPLTKNEKSIALRRCIDFKSENPYFKVAMQPSYIFHNLILPSEFAERHLMQQPTGSAILCVPDGGTWHVKFTYENQIARFLCGWLVFVGDNDLKVGDVCVFILIKDTQLSFEVVFYRSTEATNCSFSPGPIDQVKEKSNKAHCTMNWETGMSSSHDPSASSECSQFLIARRFQEPLTTSEKSRAYSSNASLEETAYKDDDDDSIEIFFDFKPRPRKSREKSALQFPRPLKKIRTSSSSKAAECSMIFRPTKTHTFDKSEVKREDGSDDDSDVILDISTPSPKIEGKSPLGVSTTTSGKAIALKRAIAFKSVNPSLWVLMRPSYITKSYLSLRSEFVKRHLSMKTAAGNAILRGPKGGTWSVKFQRKNSKALFQQGWLAFVMDNNLEVDDVCVFILIKDIILSFEVVIFRSTEAANFPCSSTVGKCKMWKINGRHVSQRPCTSSLSAVEVANKFISKNPVTLGTGSSSLLVTQRPSCLKASRVLEAANKFIPKNPFFRATVQPSSKPMYVPAEFSKRLNLQKKQTAALQVGEQFWPVNIIGYNNEGNRHSHISGGWRVFAEENRLRKGDVCTFELVEINDIVLKVHISRS